MIDSITTEVIHHRLISAAKEMARNLMRTSYNTIVYEIRDFGLGIYDADGDLLAEAPGLAIFTRSNDYALKNAIDFVGLENIHPGDVLLLNYPYWSSAHTLDVAAFAPIYHEDTLIGLHRRPHPLARPQAEGRRLRPRLHRHAPGGHLLPLHQDQDAG